MRVVRVRVEPGARTPHAADEVDGRGAARPAARRGRSARDERVGIVETIAAAAGFSSLAT